MRIELRGGAIRCFSAPHRPICFSPSLVLRQPLDDARRCSAPPPRAARRSNRLLCDLAVCLPSRAGSCVILPVRRCKGGDRGGERSRGGRLFEVTEIATTDDKMLMKKALNNTGWTSADAERISLPLNRPAMCGSAFTGAHQHHHLDHLIILVVPLEKADFGAVTYMVALMDRTGGSCHHPAPSQLILPLTIDAPS